MTIYSINSVNLVFFEITIMGRIADFTMVQKIIIDTSQSQRGSLLKRVAVHRVLYQSILNAKLTGRKELMIWGAVTFAGTGPLCFIKSMQLSTRRFWSTLCFHLLTSFMEMLISFSSRTLTSAHIAKTTSKWFADHDITVLYWPANMPDLNPIKILWHIFKRKMRNSRSNNTEELKVQ